MSTEDEELLAGGNASGRVVRVAGTVRKPWLATSGRTVEYLRTLRAGGVDVPEPLGRDGAGRLVLEYVPGQLAMDLGPLQQDVVRAVGRVVRSIHDASEGLAVPTDWPVLLPAAEPDLLCHNDLAAWNLVIDGDRLVFIDWDGAGPSTRLWDVAYAAISFAHLFPDADVDVAADRLAAFLDGYGADRVLRTALPSTMVHRAEAMHDWLLRAHGEGEEPWASMYEAGHGEHWRATTDFIAAHEARWSEACDRG
ncbi:phosphotransferase [Pedococcus soli]